MTPKARGRTAAGVEKGGPVAAKGSPGPEPEDADAETLKTIRQRFEDAVAAHAENRANYAEDVRFSCAADQWEPAVKVMRGAHRPALTFNRLNGVVKQIIGDYRQNKLAIKVLPASGEASEDAADILAGLIRNIEVQSSADVAYVNALECSARGGFGYYRIVTKYAGDDAFDQDVVIEPVHNPLAVYFDPHARKITREDANWAFVTEMVSKDAFKSLYPDAEEAGFEGDPSFDGWTRGDDVRVAEYYEKESYAARLCAFSNGMVTEAGDDEIEALASVGVELVREREARRTKIVWRKVTANQILDRREYRWKYIPIVPVIGEEINVEGKVLTRSAIHYAKDAQRMLNWQKTTATEVSALSPKAPWLGTPAQFEGFEDQWDVANVTPLARLTYNPDPQAPGPPQRVQAAPQPIAEISLANDAGVELQYTTGVFDASLGSQQTREVSGVALGERQQQGATSTVVFTDNLRKSIEYGGRIILDMIPTVYDAERVVRVIDLEGNPKSETLNQRQYDPVTGVTRVLNDVTVGKYDVTIDTGPNFASRRREALQAMMQLASAYPPLMQLAGDLVVRNIDAPGMEQIAERIKRSIPPQITTDPDSPEGQAMKNQPPPPPPEVQAQQAEAQRKQAEFQQEMAMKQQDGRQRLALEQQRAGNEMNLEQQRIAEARQNDARELDARMALERQKFEYQKDLSERKFALDREHARRDAANEVTKHVLTAPMNKETA